MSDDWRVKGRLAVWPPGTRYRIIGYCDVYDWARDNVDDILLAEADCFEVDELPTAPALIERIKALGYPYPTGKPRAAAGKCDPIYRVLLP